MCTSQGVRQCLKRVSRLLNKPAKDTLAACGETKKRKIHEIHAESVCKQRAFVEKRDALLTEVRRMTASVCAELETVTALMPWTIDLTRELPPIADFLGMQATFMNQRRLMFKAMQYRAAESAVVDIGKLETGSRETLETIVLLLSDDVAAKEAAQRMADAMWEGWDALTELWNAFAESQDVTA